MKDIKIDINVSVLRIIATLSVIWLHTCSTLSDNSTLFLLSGNELLFYKIGSQLMCFAVPIFFMITGRLLLNRSKKISLQKLGGIVREYCLQ